MRIICAWCQRVMQNGVGAESHGICSSCEAKHFPELLREAPPIGQTKEWA